MSLFLVLKTRQVLPSCLREKPTVLYSMMVLSVLHKLSKVQILLCSLTVELLQVQ